MDVLIERATSDIVGAFPGAAKRLRVNLVDIHAEVTAATSDRLFAALQAVEQNMLPDTASEVDLDRHARLWNVPRKPAVKAIGTATVTGADGAAMETDATLQTQDGTAFVTTQSALIVAGSAVVAIEAVEVGVSGNLLPSAELRFATPSAGIDTVATVVSLGGGAEQEEVDAWKARVLERLRRPPQGGNSFDYENWALAIEGVTRAWAYPLDRGIGSVTLRFMMDDARSELEGIPQAEDVAIVQASLDAVRPVTADLLVLAPVPVPFDLDVAGLSPSTPESQSAATAEIADMIRRRAIPGGTIFRSWTDEAISIAVGESHHGVITPSGDVTHDPHEIAVPGVVTFS